MKLILNSVLVLILFQGCNQAGNKVSNKMKIAVWDTYVTKRDGKIMHFDILAPVEIKDASVIYNYGKIYLKTKGQEGQP